MNSLGILEKLGNCWILITFTSLPLYPKKLFEGILAEFFTQKTTDPSILNIYGISSKKEETRGKSVVNTLTCTVLCTCHPYTILCYSAENHLLLIL